MGEWCWKLTYKIPGINVWSEYVLVPQTLTADLSDLTRVNPDTLDKEPEAQSIWWSKLEELIKLGGIPGKDGKDGKDGRDGKDGKNGQNGRDGEDGRNGKDGYQHPISKAQVGLDNVDNTSDAEKPISVATHNRFDAPTDSISYLNSINIMCSWNTRDSTAEPTYPQGISINEITKEIYVSNQGGTLLRIDTRDFDGNLKSSRSITTDNGSYSQALPFFYNSNKELCFVIRPGVGSDPITGVYSYAIYNYDTDYIGPRIGIKCDNMMDVQGPYLIGTDAGNFNMRNILIYDWESIKAGVPTLVSVIPVPGDKTSVAKNQGIVVNGTNLFLMQGAAGSNPVISIYDLITGRLVSIQEYTLRDYAATLNKLIPNTVTTPEMPYTYENEGGCKYKGKIVTLNVINNTEDIMQSRTYVVIHNDLNGESIPITTKLYKHDSNWIFPALNAPFIEYSPTHTPAVRRTGNICMFEGGVKGLTGLPASNVVLKVDPQFRPRKDRQFIQMSSAGWSANWQLGSNGDLKLLTTKDTSAAAGTWYPLPTQTWYNN